MPTTKPNRESVPGRAELDITVLICTRNRADQLGHVLASAARMRVPPALRWELLIVDNGSTDNTAEVPLSFRDQLPIRMVREECAGLSHARNRGVAEARGEYICWTDDDVLIDPEWLAAYAAVFERHPEAAVFGGRIQPVLQGPTPAWFGRLADRWPLTTLLAKRDWGDAPIPLDLSKGIVPWGANFAVRTEEQRQVAYEPQLGVSPHHRRVGEEAEVIYRLIRSGSTGWWTPDAIVQHIVPVRRQTLRYVFEYFNCYGSTLAYLEHTWPGDHHAAANERDLARIGGRAIRLSAMAALNGLLFGALWLLGQHARGLQRLMRAGLYTGAAQFKRDAPRRAR